MARKRPLGPYYMRNLDVAVASYMREHNVSQGQLAAELGMSENSMSAKMRGVKEFWVGELVTLCEIVGLGLDEACGRTVSGDREAVA